MNVPQVSPEQQARWAAMADRFREAAGLAAATTDNLPWHAAHSNLVVLVDYLASEEGWTGEEIAEVVRKPWQYEDEFRAASETTS